MRAAVGRVCGCGCGDSIDHLARQARYLNDTHRQKAHRAKKKAAAPVEKILSWGELGAYKCFDRCLCGPRKVPCSPVTREELQAQANAGCQCDHPHYAGDSSRDHGVTCTFCGRRPRAKAGAKRGAGAADGLRLIRRAPYYEFLDQLLVESDAPGYRALAAVA